MTRCCVPNCSETGTHKFPNEDKMKKLWLKAIRRVDFIPKSSSRICRNHFKESDYIQISRYTGVVHQHKFLEKTAIPSIFPGRNKHVSKYKQTVPHKDQPNAYKLRTKQRKSLSQDFPLISQKCDVPLQEIYEEFADINVSHNLQETDFSMADSTCSDVDGAEPSEKRVTQGTQTSNILRLFSTEPLLTDNQSVDFYTGLESYAKFNLLLSTLLPMAHEIKYRWNTVIKVSIEDQFLMLLIKLRMNKPDVELAKMFGVKKTDVLNVIVTWINFVSDIWSLIDIWPCRELVNIYMPDVFRKYYPYTRVIIDSTEIPIQKLSQPEAQKVTSSRYKHRNTLKVIVGSTPGGLLTYCSGAYAGSVSDHQILEHSNLLELCEPGDSIMADCSCKVQDLFACKGVVVNIPTFLNGKSQIPGVLFKQDQKQVNQRVHMVKLINLTKAYKILKDELNQCYVPLGTKIFHICLMLCNFREGTFCK